MQAEARTSARLLSPIYDLKHLEATFSKSKIRSQIQNPYGPVLGFRFLTVFMSPLLPNFCRIVESQLQILGIPQMEDIFSIVLTNLYSWLNVSSVGGGAKVLIAYIGG